MVGLLDWLSCEYNRVDLKLKSVYDVPDRFMFRRFLALAV